MRITFRNEGTARLLTLGAAMAICMLFLGLPGGAALADDKAPQDEPKAKSSSEPSPAGEGKKVEEAGDAEAKVEAKAEDAKAQPVKRSPVRADLAGRARARNAKENEKQRAVPRRVPRHRRGAPFEMDPNAKWVCEQTIVSSDPVWRGEKDLTFAFEIKNAGTADLQIRAKGG